MIDQAQALRNLVRSRMQQEESQVQQESTRSARFITVSSGKGGVGKSNFTLNFALTLQSLGKKVLIFDADIGMANIDVLMGVSSRYNLYHLISRERTIQEIISTGPNGLSYIPGGSGVSQLFSMSDQDIQYFMSQIELLASQVDYILFDTGAGISKENMRFIASADECLLVTTPEPTSITDAYALMKVVQGEGCQVPFRLIVNRVGDKQEAAQTASKINLAARRFLDIQVPLLGDIADDSYVVKAVKRQTPFTIAFPNCPAARDVKRMAQSYVSDSPAVRPGTLTGIKGFMQKWLLRTK